MLDDSLRVADLMTREVMTLERNDKLAVADDIMRLGRIRHMLVIDDSEGGKLVGIVSQRDLFHGGLLRALGYGTHAKQRALEAIFVKEAMRTKLVTVTPDTPLREAAKLMAEEKIGCLPVMQDSKVVGILTEGDFVLQAAGLKQPPESS